MGLSTRIRLTAKQLEADAVLRNKQHDRVLLLGGSGSGKSFLAVYRLIADALRYKAPVLIARDKLTDLTAGVTDQIVPAVLQLLAVANGQDRYDTWRIDGLKFAVWSDKRTKLSFATGGYVRFAGLSKRDITESGTDKILSPSWLHVLIEEASEVPWETVELLMTRLRYAVPGVSNKLIMTENPPSINHWSYTRFFDFKKLDGSTLSKQEQSQHIAIPMQPRDNEENLSASYIQTLSQLTGARKKRFYDGAFQDTEEGEIFKTMTWTSVLPEPYQWDRLIVYTDPTPLVTAAHSTYADYKASVLVGLYDGRTYVIDVRAIRGSTTSMIQCMHQLYEASPNPSITQVWMENKQVPSDFDQVIKTYSAMTGWMVPVHKDKRSFGDKTDAIEKFLQPLFENDMIFFNEAFRNTVRGKQTQHQILKFSRKRNKDVHDDIPESIMKADTKMKGTNHRKQNTSRNPVQFVQPGYVYNDM